MKTEFLAFVAHSPLLAFPIFAFILFMSVFITVVVTTMSRSAKSYEPTARLPIDEGDES